MGSSSSGTPVSSAMRAAHSSTSSRLKTSRREYMRSWWGAGAKSVTGLPPTLRVGEEGSDRAGWAASSSSSSR